MHYGANDYRSYLAHHGIKGMHWGIRRFQAYGSGGYDRKGGKKGKVVGEAKSQHSRIDKEKVKKAAIAGATVAATVGVGVLYARHKDAVDAFVKSQVRTAQAANLAKASQKAAETRKYVEFNKEKILSSPKKVLKYQKYLSKNEVKQASEYFESVRKLHQVRQDEIRRGANYAQAFLAYTAAATTAYGLKNSPLVKDAKKQIKDQEKKRNG